MAKVSFRVTHEFASPAETLWLELTDWSRNGDWIPATRMDVAPGDPRTVGASFIAYTGFGPLVLEDRMRVTRINWEPTPQTGVCEVKKLGPVLLGFASFTVTPSGPPGTERSKIEWIEDVEISRLPNFLAPAVAKAGAIGFSLGMRSLAKQLNS